MEITYVDASEALYQPDQEIVLKDYSVVYVLVTPQRITKIQEYIMLRVLKARHRYLCDRLILLTRNNDSYFGIQRHDGGNTYNYTLFVWNGIKISKLGFIDVATVRQLI
jgi:hypothetical protein